jgi:hypothetical protein
MEIGARHASRSNGLLRVEASLTMVFQSGLKTSGGATMVVHVAPLWKLHRKQVEGGRVDVMDCVGPCYPTFTVFNVLVPRGIVFI